MRKGWIVLLALVLVAALALPAMADIKASGFYRSKAYYSNFIDGYSKPSLRTDTPGDEKQTNSLVEQRFRVKWEFGTENVKAVWYLESDMIWGDAAGSLKQFTTDTTGLGANRNTGGALGGDRVQTETKNIYVWFKVPDTSLEFTVGLQNQSDDYAGVIYGAADMAGIFMTGKYEPVKYKIGWADLYENDTKKTDGQNLYYASVDFKPTKESTLGINFYFLQDDTPKNAVVNFTSTVSGAEMPSTSAPFPTYKRKVYMPGVNGTVKLGPVTLDGFAMVQFGKAFEWVNNTTGLSDIDAKGYMFDLRGDMKLGPGNAFLEGIYLSGSDDPWNDYKAPITLATREGSPGGNSAYSRINSYMMLASPDTINVSQCLLGCSGAEVSSDLGNQGRGMYALGGGYKMKLTEKLTGQANVVYLSAVKLLRDQVTGQEENRKDKDMGTEFNARIDYNLYKGLDVGLVGAYVIIGDFFSTQLTPGGGFVDVKDPWMGYARVNYSF